MNAPQFSVKYNGAKAPTLYKVKEHVSVEPFQPEVILSFEESPLSSTDTSMFYRKTIGYSVLPLNSPTKKEIF
jgi:hypothetical protein